MPSGHLFFNPKEIFMKTRLLMLSVAISCALSSAAFAMDKVEYKTQKDAIAGDYKVSRDKCNSLKANAKDICISEAKGAEKVGKAELEAKYSPSARHDEKVSMARGSAAYSTAKEKCDDASGNAKAVCNKEAKAAYVTVKDEARVTRLSAESGKFNAGARNMANKDEREANYKAASARCDGMAGTAKDTCAADAKSRYGMK
jgi:hypothetical protein